MSAYDRFSSTSNDLATFFRHLATPVRRYYTSTSLQDNDAYEWERLRAKHVGTTKRLDLFDHQLWGEKGAETFLQALEQSPGVETVNLSSNNFGDRGVMAITSGMKRLRARGIGACLKELNLSSNQLTDVSLHLLALNLLQSSPHPPSLTHLYLTANKFTLEPSLAAFLGSCLSSSKSSLRCLSLTNNPAIGNSGTIDLLRHLNLSFESFSQLSQIHLSVCNLTPDCAEPIAKWLEDPQGGARLQVLCANGNTLSEAGVRRIIRAITTGKAPSLIHLELFANELRDQNREQWQDVVDELEKDETEEDRLAFREKLEQAKKINKTVFKETRLAALGLLAKGRIMFGPLAPRSPSPEPSSAGKRDHFPFHRLPIEIQVQILRCTLDYHPSSYAHRYLLPSHQFLDPPPSSDEILLSPLTETQFLSILAHCASPQTLHAEIRIASTLNQVPSLQGHFPGKEYGSAGYNRKRVEQVIASVDGGSFTGGEADDSDEAWEEWFLRVTGCDRFQRQ